MIPTLTRKYFAHYRGFNKAVWLNIFAVFVNTFGFITGSFFAIYLSRDKGLAIETISIFFSIGSIGAMFGSYFGGWLGDKYSPVKLAQIFLGLFGLCVLMFPFTKVPAIILLVNILVNVLYAAFRPVNNIILLAHVDAIERARVMGLYRMAFNLGLAFSMVIGGLMAEYDFNWYFYFCSTMSFLATFLLIRFQKEMQIPASWKPPVNIDDKKFSFWQIFTNKPFLLLSALYLGYCVIYFQVRMTFALYMTQDYHLSVLHYAFAFIVNLAVVVIFEVPLMNILKKRNQISICIWGILLIGIGLGMLPFGHGFWFASLSVLIWSLGEVLTSSPFYVLVMHYADPRGKGTYLGFFQSLMSLGSILFPIVGGSLLPIAHGKILWFGCFFGSFILIAGFTRLKRSYVISDQPTH